MVDIVVEVSVNLVLYVISKVDVRRLGGMVREYRSRLVSRVVLTRWRKFGSWSEVRLRLRRLGSGRSELDLQYSVLFSYYSLSLPTLPTLTHWVQVL